MRKINVCHYSFISFQDNNFAILCYSEKELSFQKEILKNLFPDSLRKTRLTVLKIGKNLKEKS